ncbi:VOC family protein [Novosphingobium sp.]|uniref:VOC family protein n=1 Tax=Novosphingobium sp. TaxID=1874826 RepID=UPI003B527C3D
MSEQPKTPSIFIKIVCDDEEKMADYYMKVYGLQVWQRVAGQSVGVDEAFREVILMRPNPDIVETVVLFKFVDRPKPRDQQSIVGWITDDIEALNGRIVAHGGTLVGPLRDMPEHGIRVQFSEDPEGALSENVQMVAAQH